VGVGMIDVRMRIYSLLLVMMVCLPAFSSAFHAQDQSALRLYRRYCVSCHGSDGKATTSKGRLSHARNFTDAQWQADVSDERVFNSIMNGRNVRGNMPAFSDKLKENEVNSLVSFVRAFKGQQ